MIDWMIYTKIQEAKRKGLNKTQTARWLNLNRETVRTYWDMPPDKFAQRLEASQHRESKVDKYNVNSIIKVPKIIGENSPLYYAI